MFISTFRIIKFAFQNFWRNIWLSLMTISMLVLTLLTINVLLALNQVTNQVIQLVENRIEISVYFKDTADPKKINSAITYLRSLPQVKDIQEISADEALNTFKERHANDTVILASLDEIGKNPFGSTLVVKAYSAKDFDVIIDALNNPQYRDAIREKDFSDYQEIVGKIRATTAQVRTVGIIFSAIFALIAILIIFNTVRITMYIHREEIGIMRLVGASGAFIRSPFLFETVLTSFITTLIVAAIVYPSFAFLEPKMTQYFGGGSVGLISYFEQNGFMIFGIQFLILLIITMASTGLAMRKYLKI